MQIHGNSLAPAGRAAVAEIAPTGRLRAAINLGNAALAARNPDSGALSGVTVDLAKELAGRLGLPLELVAFAGAGEVVKAAPTGAWDLAFLAVDPARAEEIDFTAPYAIIEGAYLVREDSHIRNNEDVDKTGVRVATATGSAYDLFLTRNLKSATIMRAPGALAVTDRFVAEGLDVSAGVRQQLEADAKRLSGLRVLPGRFMAIHQAMALPRGRAEAFAWLRLFVEEIKASGLVSETLARNGIEGVGVAPPDKS
ncbi:MAG TPA: ABC transporter substrate-binding protein [Rectinemataceae bacterium]|nr:ABC transporter substrate-binding protein [Rectinemataceae bacterium]